MNENTTVPAAEVTAEMIEAWKKKHGEVFKVTVDKDLPTEKNAYVRKPNRKELSYAMAASNGGKDIIAMQEALIRNCWLGGDLEMQTQDEYFFALADKVSELMQKKEGELVKL